MYRNTVEASSQKNKNKLLEAIAHDTALQNEHCADSLEYDEQARESSWDIAVIEGHCHVGPRLRKRTELKCRWLDPNRSTSWVDFYAVVLHDPIPIVRYARDKHIHSQKPFRSVINYCMGDSPSYLARAFKEKVQPGGPKFKFGVEVPLRMKDTI